MEFPEAAKRVHLGRSILFTGAGFSFGATSTTGKNLIDAKGLASELSKRVDEETLPLDLASDKFLELFGAGELVKEIQSLFTVATYQDYHRHISRLPWRRIYTTNYDNLLETCIRADAVVPNVATLSDDPRQSLDSKTIVHLNGFAERLSRSYWDPDAILTTTDYLTDKVRSSPWAEVFRSDISLADSIIFLGYSLYDLDIARILFENPDTISKTFFVLGDSADRATVLKASRLGRTLEQNVSDVAALFPEVGSAEAPAAAPFVVALSKVDFDPSPAAPKADQVIAFLTKGDLDDSLMARSVLNGTADYYISRTDIDEVMKAITGGARRVLIHSDLGNGKSLALSELAIMLSVARYSVYTFAGSTEGFEHDFAFLNALSVEARSMTAILVEDALSFIDPVKVLTANFPQLVIVATARSAAVETRLQSVSEAFGEDYITYELNELADDEAKELNQLLLSHGLWGERQGWSNSRRLSFIKQNCSSHLSSVLLSVCKSALVSSRLAALLKSIHEAKDPTFYSLLVVLAMTYVGRTVSIAQVCEIVQEDLFKTAKAQGNAILKEFVHFENNRVAVRSPIFAQAVLSDLISDHVIIEMVPDIIFRLERLSLTNDFYRLPIRRLMRFGGIERVLSGTDKAQKLVSFYENLRATGMVAQNPQFWLQYAIARMSFRDYEGAELNFDAAFGLVRGRPYDPYQIENQYARFLLESRTETTIWNDYFEAAEKAHIILKSQMRNFDEGDYPYNVAAKYLPFIETRHAELDQDQLDAFSSWCDELLEIAEQAPQHIKRRGYWRTFKATMLAVKDLVPEVR